MSADIRILKEQEADLLYPLIEQLNPGMGRERFDTIFTHMRSVGIQFAGLYNEAGELVAACSYWIGARFYCGRMMHVDSFVVDATRRSGGLGSTLLNWLEETARQEGCTRLILDAYVNNDASHRFYFRQGFSIVGFHFNKMLEPA